MNRMGNTDVFDACAMALLAGKESEEPIKCGNGILDAIERVYKEKKLKIKAIANDESGLWEPMPFLMGTPGLLIGQEGFDKWSDFWKKQYVEARRNRANAVYHPPKGWALQNPNGTFTELSDMKQLTDYYKKHNIDPLCP